MLLIYAGQHRVLWDGKKECVKRGQAPIGSLANISTANARLDHVNSPAEEMLDREAMVTRGDLTGSKH